MNWVVYFLNNIIANLQFFKSKNTFFPVLLKLMVLHDQFFNNVNMSVLEELQ